MHRSTNLKLTVLLVTAACLAPLSIASADDTPSTPSAGQNDSGPIRLGESPEEYKARLDRATGRTTRTATPAPTPPTVSPPIDPEELELRREFEARLAERVAQRRQEQREERLKENPAPFGMPPGRIDVVVLENGNVEHHYPGYKVTVTPVPGNPPPGWSSIEPVGDGNVRLTYPDGRRITWRPPHRAEPVQQAEPPRTTPVRPANAGATDSPKTTGSTSHKRAQSTPSQKVKTVYVKRPSPVVYREAINDGQQRAIASAIIGVGLGMGMNGMMRGSMGGGGHHMARGNFHHGGRMSGMQGMRGMR